jgi:protein gp37
MAEKTEIAWCDSTFNPWIGCQKVSPGCDNCYAETLMDKRYHRVEWGPHGERKRTSAGNWRNPLIWDRHHAVFQAKHGRRQRVFCSSLADVFDNQVPNDWRADMWALIASTPNLDWLLLTKRPENIRKMLPGSYVEQLVGRDLPWPWPNVWLGVTAENQEMYDRRWPILRDIPAAVRFISYEPAIGPLRILGEDQYSKMPDWLICGGESGPGYRDMPSQWANDIGWICKANGIPFFMKQMAGKKPIPPGLMVREFPVAA